MADEQHRWLDRETAERLLRGEPLEAVDMAARDRAERLAKTLDALTVEPPPTSAELPGEAAALAAFRKARADRADDWVGGAAQGPARPGRSTASRSSDAGLVRIGGPDGGGPRRRRGRTVRFGLAAALAVGMVGSVAVAAGTGVLPTPFGESAPDPAASVSASATPDRPLVPPSLPGAEPSPEGSATDAGRGTSRDTARDGASPGSGSGSAGSGSDDRAACRDLREGKGLTADRRHTLEGAAGGSSYVKKYCQGVLKGTAGTDDDVESHPQKDGESGKGGKGGKGDKDGKDDDGEGGRGGQGRNESGRTGNHGDHGDHGSRGRQDGDGDGAGGPRHHGRASYEGSGAPSASPSLRPKRASVPSDPSPTPSYTTL